MVGVSLGRLAGLIIGTGEGSLVWLSLGLTLGSTLESPNTGDYMPVMLMLGIFCVRPSGAFITSKINSVQYCQLLELLTL